jgi:hypothetical protein
LEVSECQILTEKRIIEKFFSKNRIIYPMAV